jgi:F0F1-type ATP synthase assembly protein I
MPLLAMTSEQPPSERRTDPAGSRLIGAASMVLGGCVTGVAIGYALDQWLDSAPTALLICSFLFTSAGFYQLFKAAR